MGGNNRFFSFSFSLSLSLFIKINENILKNNNIEKQPSLSVFSVHPFIHARKLAVILNFAVLSNPYLNPVAHSINSASRVFLESILFFILPFEQVVIFLFAFLHLIIISKSDFKEMQIGLCHFGLKSFSGFMVHFQ